jgi:hypothetical protein
LAAAKAACIASFHGMLAAGFGPPFSWSVSGLRISNPLKSYKQNMFD